MGRYNINPDIKKAETLPTSFYTDPSIFSENKEMVFASSWQFADDSSWIDSYTSFPLTLLDGFLDEPLLLTYNGNRINCLSNVCTHRGNVLIEKASQASNLICGYHGRGFDLDGQYKYMPGFDKTEKLPRECDHLANIPMTRWNQFLFVSLNPGFDFSGVMKAMDDRIGFLPISNFRFMPKKSRDYEVKAHWALYCNNYLEGFHIPFVHKALNEVIHYPDYKTVLFDHCNLQIGYSKNRTEAL